MNSRFSTSKRKEISEPGNTADIRHTKLGVWDLYEELNPNSFSLPSWLTTFPELYDELVRSLPYLLRMVKDIVGIRSCRVQLVSFIVMRLLLSLLPAVDIWYSGQMLTIVQTPLNERRTSKHQLIHIALGNLLCSVSINLLRSILLHVQTTLDGSIGQFYTVHYFHALARLDLPTFEDVAVQRQIQKVLPRNSCSIVWQTIMTISTAVFKSLTLISQFIILIRVLGKQRNGLLLAILCFIYSMMSLFMQRLPTTFRSVWAATTKDKRYIRTEGLKRTVNEATHRKEMVAGNMWKYMLNEYAQSIQHFAGGARDFYDHFTSQQIQSLDGTMQSVISALLSRLPQIVFTLGAIQDPASMPITLASLNIIIQTANNAIYAYLDIASQDHSIKDQIASVRDLYQILEIPNKIPDGTVPFPENQKSTETGISIEFRDVSFRYPDTNSYALRNVSFKIEAGQLCVLIGVNGSGKSTILKLIARIYDTTEGQILVDGIDIKKIRLDDLRRSISVLFQDYTLFPLSIKDNIGLGYPENANDDDKILEAALLGGADEIIRRLPEGFNTYLERPVTDHYSGHVEGTIFHGRPTDYSNIRRRAGMDASSSKTLSGGQLQRIALSRTFMRSLTTELEVGLLLFDEPSASLDPVAEHELFERLRQLRGHKTMMFSSHRFGNLTRHADIILYMNDSEIVEAGGHTKLLEKDGEYARIWKLQAQAFI
ncbi:P-loop containing nucleoside triphosphate hydrolase protein [Amanita rubescens]|nr:P-loop containing nucleoside triphosphate hydrolase protein [Amanita rubescens]